MKEDRSSLSVLEGIFTEGGKCRRCVTTGSREFARAGLSGGQAVRPHRATAAPTRSIQHLWARENSGPQRVEFIVCATLVFSLRSDQMLVTVW